MADGFCRGTGRIGAVGVAILLVSGVASTPGAGLQIEVGEDRLISGGVERWPVVESHLAAHPDDPSHLLATAMVTTLPLPEEPIGLAAESGCATWLSRDGGASWNRHDHRVPGCGDPWVTITANGVAIFIALGNDGMVAYRSEDGGERWNEHPFAFGSGHDHPTLALDTTDGPFGGSVYVASGRGTRNPERQFRWSVYVARSSDEGASFPAASHVIASNLSYEAHTPAVLADGTLLVPFSDHHTIQGGRLEIGARRSWAVRSSDGGASFTEPLFITDRCDGRGGWPSLAAGPGDALWFVCVGAEFDGILLFRSTDRGESWSQPARVDGGDGEATVHTRVPSLAVTGTGLVGISWYDRRDDPEASCQRLYFAATADGGESFTAAAPVSGALSCPDAEGNGWTAGRFPGGGDYAGLVATGPSSFYAIWSDARDGRFRLRGAPTALRR